MINNNTSISGDADAHHLSRCWNVQKNLSDLPCIERKMFISFKEKTYWDIEMPKEAGRDQIKLVTASGSQCYCATENGLILRCDLTTDSKIETDIVPTSSDFSEDKTRVKFLLAGYYHVIAIKESNKIYVHVLSENSQYGKLERASSNAVEPFSLVSTKNFITEGKHITQAACGTYSTIVVLNDRYIYVAGRVETQLSDFTPFQVGSDYPFIRSVSAGYGHMVVQTMNGDIYAMGMNNYGQTLSVSSSSTLEKVTESLPGLVNITAIRLSHLTCHTTNNAFVINGYVGNDIDSYEAVKAYHYRKLIDYAHELKIFGGFTSIVTFNERTRELMACGSTQNAPGAPYNILTVLKQQFAKNVEISSYIDTHTVVDVACGSSLVAVLMDTIKKDTLLVNNLLKMKKYSVKELEHSSETVPFHDVIIIH